MFWRTGALSFLVSMLFFSVQGQVDSSYTIILIKKSTPTKRVVLKKGDRIVVINKDWTEVQGKIADIQARSIHFSNDSVSVENIRSIKKKKPFYLPVLGVTAVAIGGLVIFGGQMSDGGGPESTIIGTALITGSIFLFHQKKFSSKKWDIAIER